MYITKIRLKNIRCFRDFEVELKPSKRTPGVSVFVGDNATGKTALLRSIAIGLCDETSAAGLMRESEEGYIRRGESKGLIEIELMDRRRRGFHKTTTIITREQSRDVVWEKVRQKTKPEVFPWGRVFACAYGAGRGTSGTGDIPGWTSINAVYNLFNYSEGLQNPELVILRPGTRVKERVSRMLGRILLDNPRAVKAGTGGITVDGPWGENMPLRDLADGYRSSFLWITDFLGWALAYNPAFTSLGAIWGIVMVDEVEQHLHATWQRRIVHQLRRFFPSVQFIFTTHSPLVAASVGSLAPSGSPRITTAGKHDSLVHLELQRGNEVKPVRLPSMRYWRVDQVLASRAFRYLVEDDPDVEALLRELSVLKEKEDNLSPSERERFKRFRKRLGEELLPRGQTLIERDLERERLPEVRRSLRRLLKDFERSKRDSA